MPTLYQRLRRIAFGYDAIDPKNKRKEPTSILRSEDAELDSSGRRKMIGGVRDIVRNYTIASWMIRRHVDYVTSFSFQAKTGNKSLDHEIERRVRWASRPENFDRARRHGRQRALRLAEIRRTEDGDVLPVRMSDGSLQWIEGDRVRKPHDSPPGIERQDLVHGVLTDTAGAAKAYCVCRRGLHWKFDSTFEFERMVPAHNAYLHAYWDRFDQTRGISPLKTALNELRDTYEVFDYARAKMKVSQLFALAFYREAGEDETPQTQASSDGTGYEVDFGRGPTVLDLDPGDRAEFLESRTPSVETRGFCEMVIQIALKALDIPYSFYNESFTNYSGSRGAMLQYDRACEPKRDENRALLDWWTTWRLVLLLQDGAFPGADISALLDGWEWHATAVPWIDPLKERLGDIQAVGAAMDTRTRILRRHGLEFDDIVDELAYEAKRLREAGLPLNMDDSHALISKLTTDDHHAEPASRN